MLEITQNVYYRQIRRLIYVLRSQVPPLLLLWQSWTEHIYTDSGSRDVWVNNGRQSPPQTDEGSLYVEVIQSQNTSLKLVMTQNWSDLHSLDVKELWGVAVIG